MHATQTIFLSGGFMRIFFRHCSLYLDCRCRFTKLLHVYATCCHVWLKIFVLESDKQKLAALNPNTYY